MITPCYQCFIFLRLISDSNGVHRGSDRMVVGFITTNAISVYHHQHCEIESRSGEVYWIQHYVCQ